MESNLVNRQQEQIEQLYAYDGVFLEIADDGAGGVAYNQGEINIRPLRPGFIYEIKRVKVGLRYFLNTIDNVVAYPPFEQFALTVKIKADIVRQTPFAVMDNLFAGLMYSTTNGQLPEATYEVPFIFQTSQVSRDPIYIRAIIENLDSRFTSISGMTIPPVPTFPIYIRGYIIFEGVSYPIGMGGADEKKYEEKASEAGLDVDNAIDIDI